MALSYFGTDHSQVGRYLTAKNISESRKGLLMNGLVKVPMQFCILLIGVLIFSFYLYHKAPVYFDEAKMRIANNTAYGDSLIAIEGKYNFAFNSKRYDDANIYRNQYKDMLKKHCREMMQMIPILFFCGL